MSVATSIFADNIKQILQNKGYIIDNIEQHTIKDLYIINAQGLYNNIIISINNGIATIICEDIKYTSNKLYSTNFVETTLNLISQLKQLDNQ